MFIFQDVRRMQLFLAQISDSDVVLEFLDTYKYPHLVEQSLLSIGDSERCAEKMLENGKLKGAFKLYHQMGSQSDMCRIAVLLAQNSFPQLWNADYSFDDVLDILRHVSVDNVVIAVALAVLCPRHKLSIENLRSALDRVNRTANGPDRFLLRFVLEHALVNAMVYNHERLSATLDLCEAITALYGSIKTFLDKCTAMHMSGFASTEITRYFGALNGSQRDQLRLGPDAYALLFPDQIVVLDESNHEFKPYDCKIHAVANSMLTFMRECLTKSVPTWLESMRFVAEPLAFCLQTPMSTWLTPKCQDPKCRRVHDYEKSRLNTHLRIKVWFMILELASAWARSSGRHDEILDHEEY
jgi:hypothetical protein